MSLLLLFNNNNGGAPPVNTTHYHRVVFGNTIIFHEAVFDNVSIINSAQYPVTFNGMGTGFSLFFLTVHALNNLTTDELNDLPL
jgi:hypothetical protein